MAAKTVQQEAIEQINQNAAEAMRPVNYSAQLRDSRARRLSEKKVSTYLSPMYRPYLGNVADITINGVTIFFPVDGNAYEVPSSFADEIARRRMAIDAMLTKQNRMADVANNHESTPGELKLF